MSVDTLMPPSDSDKAPDHRELWRTPQITDMPVVDVTLSGDGTIGDTDGNELS
jgi:hypothetical protein